MIVSKNIFNAALYAKNFMKKKMKNTVDTLI